jgi:hypothetical protein
VEAYGMHATIAHRMKAVGPTRGFDYLRLFLALGVVAWHSIYVSGDTDAMHAVLAGWIGVVKALLLPMFFSLSGFLVAGSMERTRTLEGFATLRVLRIAPALAVEVLLSAILLGATLTTLPLSDYFLAAAGVVSAEHGRGYSLSAARRVSEQPGARHGESVAVDGAFRASVLSAADAAGLVQAVPAACCILWRQHPVQSRALAGLLHPETAWTAQRRDADDAGAGPGYFVSGGHFHLSPAAQDSFAGLDGGAVPGRCAGAAA